MLSFFSSERFHLSSGISSSFDDIWEVISFFRVIMPDPGSSIRLIGAYLFSCKLFSFRSDFYFNLSDLSNLFFNFKNLP